VKLTFFLGTNSGALRQGGQSLPAHIALTITYGLSGREEEACTTAAQVLKIDPKFSGEHLANRSLRYKNQDDKEHFIDALRKAGLN